MSIFSEQSGWEHKEMKMAAGSGAIKFELIWRCKRRSQWNGQGWRYKRENNWWSKGPKGAGVELTVEGSQNSSYFKNKSESCSVVSDSLQPYGLYSSRNSPGQNTGVGSLSLLQGIFPTRGSNPGLPHCRQILYQLSHKRKGRLKRSFWEQAKWGSWWVAGHSRTTFGQNPKWQLVLRFHEHITAQMPKTPKNSI